jgi:DNA polymerase III epsilon subunit-like protein
MGNVIDLSSYTKMCKEDYNKIEQNNFNNKIDQRLKDCQFIVLDCETGGVNPFKHSVLTIGMLAVKYDPKIERLAVVDELHLKVKNEDNCYFVTDRALEINGINLYDIHDNGTNEEDSADMIADFVEKNFGEVKPIVIGHNVGMDKYFVYKLLIEAKLNWDDVFSHRTIDTMSILWSMYFNGEIPKEACSSKGAFEFFCINNEKPHDAISDCYATLELFDMLVIL